MLHGSCVLSLPANGAVNPVTCTLNTTPHLPRAVSARSPRSTPTRASWMLCRRHLHCSPSVDRTQSPKTAALSRPSKLGSNDMCATTSRSQFMREAAFAPQLHPHLGSLRKLGPTQAGSEIDEDRVLTAFSPPMAQFGTHPTASSMSFPAPSLRFLSLLRWIFGLGVQRRKNRRTAHPGVV